MPRYLALCGTVLFWLSACACAQQNAPAQAAAAGSGNALIQLDVAVTDKSGKSIPGLAAADFTLLDNNHPARILSFQSYSATEQLPIEVILLIDTMNMNFDGVSYVRAQVEKFLRQNGGRLSYPVSVDWIAEKSLRAQQEPVRDGNVLADQLAATKSRMRTITPSQGGNGAIERFQRSIQTLKVLAQNEAHRPDKKLVIWIGPGWPMLSGPNVDLSSKAHQELFRDIVELSSQLRKARISLYSISPGQANIYTFRYQIYVKGVSSFEKTLVPDLSLKVLAVQSGGLVLPPSNNLPGSIQTCLQDAEAFYSLSFEPPPVTAANPYHELRVLVDRAGLTARTSTGYYDQPAASLSGH
jgi:VWFA-related protein